MMPLDVRKQREGNEDLAAVLSAWSTAPRAVPHSCGVSSRGPSRVTGLVPVAWPGHLLGRGSSRAVLS